MAAEKSEGTRDKFFELEKALVGRVVEALGVKLGGREKAEVAKVETRSFDAFRSL